MQCKPAAVQAASAIAWVLQSTEKLSIMHAERWCQSRMNADSLNVLAMNLWLMHAACAPARPLRPLPSNVACRQRRRPYGTGGQPGCAGCVARAGGALRRPAEHPRGASRLVQPACQGGGCHLGWTLQVGQVAGSLVESRVHARARMAPSRICPPPSYPTHVYSPGSYAKLPAVQQRPCVNAQSLTCWMLMMIRIPGGLAITWCLGECVCKAGAVDGERSAASRGRRAVGSGLRGT
jgi:hypothetical protein